MNKIFCQQKLRQARGRAASEDEGERAIGAALAAYWELMLLSYAHAEPKLLARSVDDRQLSDWQN